MVFFSTMLLSVIRRVREIGFRAARARRMFTKSAICYVGVTCAVRL